MHFTSTDKAATLPVDYPFSASGATGTNTFTNLTTLRTAGTQTITVTDTSNKLITGTTTLPVASTGP